MASSRYSAEFKADAVRAVLRSHESVADVARRLGVHPQTLRAWVRERGLPPARDRSDPHVAAAVEDSLRSKDWVDNGSEGRASSTGMAGTATGAIAAGGLGLAGLAVPKASDVLAARLRDQILTGELREGRMLPVERLLAGETGLSRGTVREALRILELEGLVATRPGRAGGTVVQRPSPRVAEHTLGVFIRGRQLSLRELLEAREALEPAAAELAATYRTAADVARLEEVTALVEAVVDDVPRYLRENVTWHVTVAEISHNELVHVFMRSLSTAIHEGTDIADFNSEDVRRAALAAHRKVLEAIRAGDPAGARRAMQRHVHAFRERATRWPGGDELMLGEPAETDDGREVTG